MVNWKGFSEIFKGKVSTSVLNGNPLGTYGDGLKEMDKETSDTAKKNQEKAEETRRLAAEKKAQQEKVAKAREEAAQEKLKAEDRKRAERLEEWEKAQERARIKLAAILLLIQHLEDEARASARESEAASRRQNNGRNLLEDSQDARPKDRNSRAAERELANLLKKKKQAERDLNVPKPWS